MPKKFLAGSITLNGVNIASIVPDSLTATPEINQAILTNGGTIFPSFGGAIVSRQKLSCQIHEINAFSEAVRIGSSVTIHFREYSADGVPSSAWLSMTAQAGLIVPTNLTWQLGQPATLGIDIYPESTDGLTDPITIGTSAGTIAKHPGAYTGGACTLGNSVEQLTASSIDFGYQVGDNAGENGLPYCTFTYIQAQAAKINATTTNMEENSEARINHGQYSTTASLSFRELTEGGVPGAPTFVITAPAVLVEATASGGLPSTTSLMAHVLSTNGSNYLTFSG